MRSEEIVAGLLERPKSIASKYLYDARGSRLYEEICLLQEYYPARAEAEILRRNGAEIAARLGPGVRLLEPGAGNGGKAEALLERLEAPAGYVPIDVSPSALQRASRRLARRFPGLEVRPVAGDFTRPIEPPTLGCRVRRDVLFFPGSTIGNFHPWDAVGLMREFVRTVGPWGRVVVGVDLKKEPEIIERAYNDPCGVTAEFNLNLLRRLNRELGADFRARSFRHRAFYDEARGRVEMHLVSGAAQRVRLDGHVIDFGPGESVRTEVSYKYAPEDFARLSEAAGLSIERSWTDGRGWFGLFLCAPRRRDGDGT